MICFVISEKKKCFFVLVVAHGDPIFGKVGPKNGNVQGFQQKIFGTTRFQLKLLISIEFFNIFHWKPAKKRKVAVALGQNLGQIRPNVVKKVKKQALSISFFSNFTCKIYFEAKGSGCTYKHLTRNLRQIQLEMPHLKDIQGQIFAQFGSKMEKTKYSQEFHFSQSVLKSQS